MQRDTSENPFAGQVPGADSAAEDTLSPPEATPMPAPRPRVPTMALPRTPVPPGIPPLRTAPPGRRAITVQFAALRAQDAAAAVLHDTHVTGATPRLVATTRDGVTIYRVVIGPFATREEAERVARTSGKSYWVYEGAP